MKIFYLLLIFLSFELSFCKKKSKEVSDSIKESYLILNEGQKNKTKIPYDLKIKKYLCKEVFVFVFLLFILIICSLIYFFRKLIFLKESNLNFLFHRRTHNKKKITQEQLVVNNNKSANNLLENKIFGIFSNDSYLSSSNESESSNNQTPNIRIKRQMNLFTDYSFMPNRDSLIGFGEKATVENENKIKTIFWKRPRDFLIKRPIVLFDKINPYDLKQGELGNCYFIAALSAIADNPERIKRLFVTKHYNEEGRYIVNLFLTGKWQQVVVDDYIPCDINLKPKFTSSDTGDLWPMILEKAFAKISRGYFNCESGISLEVLITFLGASTKGYFMNNPNLLNYLLISYQQKWVITCGTHNANSSSINYTDTGIYGTHAYTVLGIYKVLKNNNTNLYEKVHNSSNNFTDIILKLRNPWKKSEWKYEWSDNSILWNDQLCKDLGHEKKDDGVFFINWQHFQIYFQNVQICFYSENLRSMNMSFLFDNKNYIALKVDLSVEYNYIFTLIQDLKRFYSKSENYFLAKNNFIIAKYDRLNNSVEYLGYVDADNEDNWVQFKTSGEIYVIIKTLGRFRTKHFTFAVYGKTYTNIQLTKTLPQNLPENFFVKLFESYSTKNNISKILTHNKDFFIMMRGSIPGYSFLIVRNLSTTQKLTCNFQKIVHNGNILHPNTLTGNILNYTIEIGQGNGIICEQSINPLNFEVNPFFNFTK